MDSQKRKPGRPRRYEGSGAPKLMLRLDPRIHERVTAQPEGPRSYIERLVEEDISREASALVVSSDPADVPGQLLIPMDEGRARAE